ncbi:reverse transcriptase domain-containing protein, partial [Priestia megaterium]|uniref:reverse transcriptase domain-containing protein n=1 Tax=Priestia megaterium TaxID=1404 RepID=UPI003397AAC0
MRQLPGSKIGEPGMVWRLKKALYGLKQAGKELDSIFAEYGLKSTREDTSVYILPDHSVFVLLFVDDILIGYSA